MKKNRILDSLEKKYILHPFLLCIFFVLFSLQESGSDTSALEIIFSLIILFGAALVLQIIISKILIKDWLKSSYISTYLLFVSLFFVSIVTTFQEISFFSWVQVRHVLALFILSFGFLYLYLRKENVTTRFNLYLTFLFLIFIVQKAVNTVSNHFVENNQKVFLNINVENHKGLPDIYLIVLDGYAKHENLKKYWDFDNHRFLSKLDSMGFYHVKKSRSSYLWTTQVMCSILNLDYLEEGIHPNNPKVHQRIKDNLTVFFLKKNGYRIINHSIFNFGTELNPTALPVLKHILDFKQTLFYKTLLGVIASFAKEQFYSMSETFNLDRENMIYPKILKEISQDTVSSPKFVYYHSMLCHYPFYFDEKGEKSEIVIGRNPNLIEVKNWATILNKNAKFNNNSPIDTNLYTFRNKILDRMWSTDYINHIKITNNRSISLINSIFLSKRESLIILMSDHGFRFLSPNKKSNIIEESFENICHVYYPDKNYQIINDSIGAPELMKLTLEKIKEPIIRK